MALPKLAAVKSALKSLKNNVEGAYFLLSCTSPTACNFIKNWSLSQRLLKEVDHGFPKKNF